MELLTEVKGNRIPINERLYLDAINDPENYFSLDIWLGDYATGQKMYLSSIAESELSREKIHDLVLHAHKVWRMYEKRVMTA